MTGRPWRLLLLSIVGLVAAWAAGPYHVPLYDGIGFPDEPYRYVVSPPGDRVHTSPPTSAAGSTLLRNGTNPGQLQIASDERGPQVVVFLDAGAAHTGNSGHRLDLRATPRAPDRAPAGTAFDGNVYRVTIAGDAGHVALDATQASAIQLRATTARQPGATMQFRPDPTQAWQALKTVRAGNDIYQSSMAGAGDYGLTFPANAGAATRPAGSSDSARWVAIGLGALVLAMAGVIATIRIIGKRRGEA